MSVSAEHLLYNSRHSSSSSSSSSNQEEEIDSYSNIHSNSYSLDSFEDESRLQSRPPVPSHSPQLVGYFSQLHIDLVFLQSSNNSVVSALLLKPVSTTTITCSATTVVKLAHREPSQKNCTAPDLVIKEVKHKTEEIHCKQCENLKNEYNTMSQFNHPSILRPTTSGFLELSSGCSLMMPRAKCDLFEFIFNDTPSTQLFSFSSAKILVKQIGSALRYLHSEKHMVHGDVKPENILLFNDGNFKLADFGFCQPIKQITKKREFVKEFKDRNFKYMPPEFALCFEEDTQFNPASIDLVSADVFGLALTLFHFVFKSAPFDELKEVHCKLRKQKRNREDNAVKKAISDNMQMNDTRSMEEVEDEWMKEEVFADIVREKIKYCHDKDNMYRHLYKQKGLTRFWSFFRDTLADLGNIYGIEEMRMLVDLINRSITPFLHLRITLEEFLNHPWLHSKF